MCGLVPFSKAFIIKTHFDNSEASYKMRMKHEIQSGYMALLCIRIVRISSV